MQSTAEVYCKFRVGETIIHVEHWKFALIFERCDGSQGKDSTIRCKFPLKVVAPIIVNSFEGTQATRKVEVTLPFLWVLRTWPRELIVDIEDGARWSYGNENPPSQVSASMLSSKCMCYPEANFHDIKVLRYIIASRPYCVQFKYRRPQGVEKYSILDYAYRLFRSILKS